jgi:hypothetical protein
MRRVRKSFEIGDWGLERARLKAAPYIVLSDLRHAGKSYPFKLRRPGFIPQPLEVVKTRTLEASGGSYLQFETD